MEELEKALDDRVFAQAIADDEEGGCDGSALKNVHSVVKNAVGLLIPLIISSHQVILESWPF